MPANSRPYGAFVFYVELKGITEAAFSECSPLEIQTEVYEYKEGGNNLHVHRLPGRAKVSNITLKRGVAPKSGQSGPWANELWKWYTDVLKGKIERQNLSIILFDTVQGQQAARWNINEAYPVKWTGPTLKASDNQIAIEALELAHRGVQLT